MEKVSFQNVQKCNTKQFFFKYMYAIHFSHKLNINTIVLSEGGL